MLLRDGCSGAAGERDGTSEGGRLLVGRYALHAPLGEGGMGVVWRAEDLLLGRAVAIKEVRLPSGMRDDRRAATQARILREARAAARLNHPGAVTVHDVVQDAGQILIVMELVEAPNLEQQIRREGPAAAGAGRRGRPGGPGDAGGGPSGRDRAPRRQAQQHPAAARRAGEADRLRHRPAPGRPPADDQRDGARLARLHGPRAASRRLRPGRRPVSAGRHPVLRGQRPAAVPGGVGAGHAGRVALAEPDPVPCGPPLAPAIMGLLAKSPEDRQGGARLRAELERAARPSAHRTGVARARPAEEAGPVAGTDAATVPVGGGPRRVPVVAATGSDGPGLGGGGSRWPRWRRWRRWRWRWPRRPRSRRDLAAGPGMSYT